MRIKVTQHVELAMTGTVNDLNANWILSKKIIVTFATNIGQIDTKVNSRGMICDATSNMDLIGIEFIENV